MENNRPIGVLTIAATTAGFYLGAGYLSGQELWQFFGVHGERGILGMLLAISAITVMGIALFGVAKLCGQSEFDKVVIRFESPLLRSAFSYVEIFFTFCVFVVMSAGGGALLEQTTGLDAAIGSALFCACVAAVALRGITGMLSTFSLLVPILTFVTLLVAVLAALKNGAQPIVFTPQPIENPMMRSWVFSALTYLSYNFFGAVCIFSPIAQLASMRTILRGSLLAGAALMTIACAVLFSIAMFPGAASAQLPMLEVALLISPLLGYVSAVPLLLGMFGTSLSALVAVIAYAGMRSPRTAAHRSLIITLLSILAWACSLAGFGELISVLYPLCGYIGFFAIALILEHLVWLQKTSKKQIDQEEP